MGKVGDFFRGAKQVLKIGKKTVKKLKASNKARKIKSGKRKYKSTSTPEVIVGTGGKIFGSKRMEASRMARKQKMGLAIPVTGRNPYSQASFTAAKGVAVAGTSMDGTSKSQLKNLRQNAKSLSSFAGGGGGGQGIQTVGLLSSATDFLGFGKGGKMNLTGFPGQSLITPGQTGGFGLPRGPGGKLQMPGSDPRMAAYLKQFSLDDSFLKIFFRAPKGYVVMYDDNDRPYALLKSVAIQFGLWSAAKKPPISVKDWQAFKRAGRVAHKLEKIAKSATVFTPKKKKVHAHRITHKVA